MILFGSTMDWFKRHFDIKPWFVVNHEGVLYICRPILAWWDYYGPKTHQTHWRQNIWNNWLGKKGLAYESQAMTSLKGKSWGKASEQKKKRVNTTKQFHHRYCWNGIILYIYWLIQMKWQLHTTTMFAIVCLCRLSCPQHSKPDVSGYLRQCLNDPYRFQRLNAFSRLESAHMAHISPGDRLPSGSQKWQWKSQHS